MGIQGIDFKNFKTVFDRPWVNQISDIYTGTLKSLNTYNREYFDDPIRYTNRRIETAEYFNHTLSAPCICMLDYILKNIDEFEGLDFIDNGAGTGIMSAYLDKLGFECSNYDNFTQIPETDFCQEVNRITGTSLKSPSREIPDRADVLLSSWIWVDDERYEPIDFKYMMIDSKWVDNWKSIIPGMVKGKYDLVEKYPSYIHVYRKR